VHTRPTNHLIKLPPDGKRVVGEEAETLLAIISRGARTPVDAFREALPYLVPNARIDIASIKDQINFWKEQRMTPTSVDAEKIIDTSILSDASRK
jgi:hypothetical protein